jgi:competence protein ComEC
MAAVYTKSVYIILWLILCYVLLAVFLRSKKKYPWFLGSCMGVMLCVAVFVSWLEPRLDPYRFTALNVGQGQCLLLQSGSKVYVIDCGGDSPEQVADDAAATLLSYGITRLDGVILTHYDADHAAGTDYLLARISADKLYLPVSGDVEEMAHYAQRYADSIQWIADDTQFSDGNIKFSLFPAGATATGNESSMSVLCQVQKCDILITGDMSATGERRLVEEQNLPDLEVLVVGHHGSKTATTLELLHATTPDVAVISVSAENNYGHPAKETLARLRLFGCSIFRTDEMGTVIIKG